MLKRLICTILAFLLLNSCSATKDVLSIIKIGSDPETTIAIEVDEKTNNGTPFYAVVRTVEEGSFLTESYQNVADAVFPQPQDPNMLLKQVIYPGKKDQLNIKNPPGKVLGLYFLFTEPGDHWKVMIRQPYPRRYSVALVNTEIVSSS